jgi:hypothetical protein
MSQPSNKKRKRREKRRDRMKFQRRKNADAAKALPAAAAPPDDEPLAVDAASIEGAVGYVQTLVKETFEHSGRLTPMALVLVAGADHTLETPQLFTFAVQAVTPCPSELLATGVQGFQQAVGAIATISATPALDGDKTLMVVVAIDPTGLRAWAAQIVEDKMAPFVEAPDFAAQLSQALHAAAE